MATGPGPQQRFPSNIIRINFPTIGGLVIFRVSQRWNGNAGWPPPRAFLTGLPWGDIDMYSQSGGFEDPEASAAVQQLDAPVRNPVTDEMLQKYLYWAQYTKATKDTTEALPGFEIVVLDLAEWALVYGNQRTSLTTGPFVLLSQQQALDYFKNSVQTMDPPLDPNKVGVAPITYYKYPDPPGVNTPEKLIEQANEFGWSYHVEFSPGSTAYTHDDAAIFVINMAKLFRDVPVDPQTGKKPPSIPFTIDLAKKGSAEGRLSWRVQASAWSTKISDPQQDWERRDFPVEDRLVPISGIPGKFNTDLHWPLFPIFSSANIEDDDVSSTQVTAVTGQLFFGVGKIPPSVSLELPSSGGGEG